MAQAKAPDKLGSSRRPLRELVEIISRSQQKHRELIDNLDQAVFTLSPRGEILVANRRLSEILELPFPDFIGHRFSEFFDSPTMAEAKRALESLGPDGSWRGTVPARLKGKKRLRYFSCWFQAISEGGEVSAVIGWARDATSERESEIRFAELFESLREGMFFTTLDGHILDVNPALVRMLGYSSKEELQAKNFRELCADPAARSAIVRELETKDSIEDREVVLRHKSGRDIHCLASGFVLRDASGRIARLQGTMVDVTERLEIERRLRQEREFIRRLIANFPDLIAVLDRQGRYTYVSQRVEDVLGDGPQEYIGHDFGLRARPEDRPRLDEAFKRLLAGEIAHIEIEVRMRHRDGSWRILKINAGPLYEEGQINGVVASARDITDSKRVEEQLARTEKLAAMGQMLTGAAHELNNPLTAILGIGDLMRERATEEAARRHAELVLQQARRAAEIVQTLMAFSRPSASGRSIVDVAQIVAELLSRERGSLGVSNIAVRLTAREPLPLVEGDAKLLTQAFLNIVTNARQAISSVRDHGAVDVSVSANGSSLVVAFSDDGPGIPPEDLRRVFDPFFTTKRPGGGSGLGLTISLAVVKEHGGTIEVQSQPGAGATFRVFLPIAEGETDRPTRSPGMEVRGQVAAFAHRSVLVVDDEESIREIVQEGLSARGLGVDCVESAEAALELLSKRRYDVVLCDFNLPRLRGPEFLDRVRADGLRSPSVFILMTGDLVDPASAAEVRNKGAQVLQKPFHISALSSLLAGLLESRPAK
ncbi:MAG TPA: PAS domain S-box protein [Candidatus Cybelea sp.]|nr:PAS domain S-box protein [Candidatus Cybelea sp.]